VNTMQHNGLQAPTIGSSYSAPASCVVYLLVWDVHWCRLLLQSVHVWHML
jgi:hypothetical protein